VPVPGATVRVESNLVFSNPKVGDVVDLKVNAGKAHLKGLSWITLAGWIFLLSGMLMIGQAVYRYFVVKDELARGVPDVSTPVD